MRRLLVVLEFFLAGTAVAGGASLSMGLQTPPVELLRGSPFSDYFLPGIALLLLVGGPASLAGTLLVRNHPAARTMVGVSSAAIIIFEIVEMLVIGIPQGAGMMMQLTYLALGCLLAVLALISPVSRHRME